MSKECILCSWIAISIVRLGSSFLLAIPFTSPPAQKAPSEPVRMTALTSESFSKSSKVAIIAAAMMATLEDFENDSEVRAVILTGSEGAFCAGGDVKGMANKKDDPKRTIDIAIHEQRMHSLLMDCYINCSFRIIFFIGHTFYISARTKSTFRTCKNDRSYFRIIFKIF